ncbi:lambda exonuclease family protein [Brucella pituitosa]|uniref:lambda exonuclease family protein n=1 Tax=Brucella pituitosa TaxID=571256 RepID=UPI003F4AA813
MSDIIQGSPEWHALRAGKVTASRVADLIAKTKSGYAASRANYMAELLVERLTGASAQGFSSPAMQWGTDNEPDARIAYEFYADVDVEQIAFVDHASIAMTGASPDGLIGADGLLEIKCPITATHIDTLLTGSIPSRYITQMNWQMACTGRQWCDFASFDPRLPEHLRLFVKRHHRVDTEIRSLEVDVTIFIKELNEKIADLNAAYPEFRGAA